MLKSRNLGVSDIQATKTVKHLLEKSDIPLVHVLVLTTSSVSIFKISMVFHLSLFKSKQDAAWPMSMQGDYRRGYRSYTALDKASRLVSHTPLDRSHQMTAFDACSESDIMVGIERSKQRRRKKDTQGSQEFFVLENVPFLAQSPSAYSSVTSVSETIATSVDYSTARSRSAVETREDSTVSDESFAFGSFGMKPPSKGHASVCQENADPITIIQGLVLPLPHLFASKKSSTDQRRRKLEEPKAGHIGNEAHEVSKAGSNVTTSNWIKRSLKNARFGSSVAVETAIVKVFSKLEKSLTTNSLPLKHGLVGRHLRAAFKKKSRRRIDRSGAADVGREIMVSSTHILEMAIPVASSITVSHAKLQSKCEKLLTRRSYRRRRPVENLLPLILEESTMTDDTDNCDLLGGTKTEPSMPPLVFPTTATYQQDDTESQEAQTYLYSTGQRIMGTQDMPSLSVLRPSLLKSLKEVLPYGCSEENFWLRFSSDRDVSLQMLF
jgi:hypothetical protein